MCVSVMHISRRPSEVTLTPSNKVDICICIAIVRVFAQAYVHMFLQDLQRAWAQI